MKSSANSASSPNKEPSNGGKEPAIEIEARVRYSETDQMGVAHNKSYFEWFEIGRTEYCRQKKFPYKDIEQSGFFLVVAEAFCRYKKPLRYDDIILIRVVLEEITPKKAVFSYEILTKEDRTPAASGYTVHVVINAKGEVCALPAEILEKIRA